MNLLDFTKDETKNNLDNKKSEILISKHNLVSELIEKGLPKNEAEQRIYKPDKLEKINLNSNKSFGQRDKICFFVTPAELILLKNKFKIVEQFQEFRIGSTEIERFLEVLLNG